MKYAGKIDLVPMKLTMQDLRCDVYLVFSGSQCRPTAMCKQLAKLGYTGRKDERTQLRNCMKECKDNLFQMPRGFPVLTTTIYISSRFPIVSC